MAKINKRTVQNKNVLVGKIAKINKRTPYVYSGPQSILTLNQILSSYICLFVWALDSEIQ